MLCGANSKRSAEQQPEKDRCRPSIREKRKLSQEQQPEQDRCKPIPVLKIRTGRVRRRCLAPHGADVWHHMVSEGDAQLQHGENQRRPSPLLICVQIDIVWGGWHQMVQHCPDDSTIVRGNVLPRAVLVLDASPARLPCSLIGLSAEDASSQLLEQL